MAHYLRTSPDFNPARSVKITTTETVDKYTVYDIELSLGAYHWIVKHRYNEFRDLHERLVSKYKIEKNLLPPKKLFGNSSEAFIRKRQGELELYLQTLLYKLNPLPSELAVFLQFDKYEIHGITHVLAEELYHQGDLILESGDGFSLTTLQLYAVTKRLKLPEPTCDAGDSKKDIGHILDFITTVKHIKIIGQYCQLGTSNILMNDLGYELNMFKSLETLELAVCNPTKITGTEGIKKTVKKLKLFNTISKLKDILLVDVEFGQWFGMENGAVLVPVWTSLVTADFSCNQLDAIDESVKLMPRVKNLDLSHNLLTDLCHLEHLSCLTHLDISNNNIHNLEALHIKLGNITSLCLSNNKLESLQGFSKLYSLENLDISNNEISQVLEVRHVSSLPCLESLHLTNNPVTIVLDYRTKIFELFKDRAKEVALDGVKANQKELDTVAVLLALQKSKQTKDRSRKHRKAREVTIVDPSSGSPRNHSKEQELRRHHQSDAGYRRQSQPDSLDLVQCLSSHDQTDQLVGDGSSLSDTDKGCLLSSSYRASSSDQSTNDHSPSSDHTSHSSLTHLQAAASAESVTDVVDMINAEINMRLSCRPHGPDLTTEVCVQPTLGYQYDVSYASSGLLVAHGGTLLPETLPNRNDTTFVSHIQELLPSPSSLSRQSHMCEETRDQQEERIIHVTWCTVVCYTKPTQEVMACICISTENLHLLEVKSLRGESGMPWLVHMHCIPLVNLEQIVLGYQRQYLRIEEALVGPRGTYVLLTGSMAKTDHFLDSLKLAYRRAISDIDQYEDPHITANCQTEANLLLTLNRFERMTKPEDITVSLYMLVNSVDYTQEDQPFVTHSLVMTTRYLYLLKEDFVMWPQATFAVGITARPQFEVVCAFPIMGKITGIMMYDSDTYSPEKDMSLSQTFSATNTCAMVVPNFIGFGVRLTFDMGSMGQQSVDIRVSTSGMRDRFLATLTQLRKDNSERMSSPTKGSRTRLRLKEADVDSLSTNSGDSSHGAWSGHNWHSVGIKHKHKSKNRELKRQDQHSGQRPDLLPDLNKASLTVPFDHGVQFSNVPSALIGQNLPAEDCDSYPDLESADDMVSPDRLEIGEVAVVESGNSEDYSSYDDFTSSTAAFSDNEKVTSDATRKVIPCERSKEFETPDCLSQDLPENSSEAIQPAESEESAENTVDGCMLHIVQQPQTAVLPVSTEEHLGHPVIQADLEQSATNVTVQEKDTDTHEQQAAKDNSCLQASGKDPENSAALASTPEISKSELTLDVQYPSMALLSHLTECNEQIQLLHPLPDVFRNILTMEGDELLNFFYSSVAQIGQDVEELRHLLWTPVLPYTKPQKEVVTCVMVSTKAVYFVSDHDPQDQVVRLKEWKSHSRNRSDSFQLLKEHDASCLADMHLSSGVVHQCRHTGRASLMMPKTYAVLQLRDIKEVTIGLFDQSFRIVGSTPELTFTCMTRDNKLTGDFIRNLMSVLSIIQPTPSPECGASQLELDSDFYSMFNTYNRLESHEYKHQSKVKFIYPNEDLVNELLYVVSNSDGNKCQSVLHLLMYLTVFLKGLPDAMQNKCSHLQNTELAGGAGTKQLGQAISLILSEHFLTLCLEDHAHYPIPEFAFGPPPFPRLRILDNRPVKHLKRIVLSNQDDHLMTLVFSDEKDIIVNPDFDHYTPYGGRVRKHVTQVPEVSIVVIIQNLVYKEKFISLLKKQWSELQDSGKELEISVLHQ